jgi:hypothetical protein
VVAVLTIQLRAGSPDGTSLALLALAVALVFGLLAPRQTARTIERVTNFKLGGMLEIGFNAAVQAEMVKVPAYEEDGAAEERDSQGYPEIVKELKRRLRFVHAITDYGKAIGREDSYRELVHALAADHLLDHDQAQFALDLVSERDLGLSALPTAALEEFLDAAWSFAARFAFVVWDRYVRDELWERGWVVADFRQSPGHRRDFLACWNGRWILMSARVGGEKRPYRYVETRNRLERSEFQVAVAGRCIVLPGRDRQGTVVGKKGTGTDSPVKVLEWQGSLREHPERALVGNPCNQDALRPGEC